MLRVSEEDIYKVLNRCSEVEDSGRSHYPGSTYEAGVAAAIHYLVDLGMDRPDGWPFEDDGVGDGDADAD